MPISWRYSSASTVSATYWRATSSSRNPRLHNKEYTSPPGRYSITKNSFLDDMNVQNSRTIHGDDDPARISRSSCTLSTKFRCSMSCLRSTFTANTSRVLFFFARYTRPNAPAEIGFSTLKSLIVGSLSANPSSTATTDAGNRSYRHEIASIVFVFTSGTLSALIASISRAHVSRNCANAEFMCSNTNAILLAVTFVAPSDTLCASRAIS
mmetsp:Transcript_1517/g.3186  ORF Transcript_1517/g.3186 Transcript_1517/m.3186 type:complete len:210 (-) Transcript_1517:2514-3143(-)